MIIKLSIPLPNGELTPEQQEAIEKLQGSLKGNDTLRLKDWAVKQVEEWVNPYLLSFKDQVDKDGYWKDPLLHHPDGVKVFLVDIGYFGFGLMEEHFWEGWDYILKHPDASYLDIVRFLTIDDYVKRERMPCMSSPL